MTTGRQAPRRTGVVATGMPLAGRDGGGPAAEHDAGV